MSGDSVFKLPINKEYKPKPNELEFMYNIFQPKNQQAIKQVLSPFKISVAAAILFVVFSMPFVSGFTDKFFTNKLYSKVAVAVAFMIVFFIIQKSILKM